MNSMVTFNVNTSIQDFIQILQWIQIYYGVSLHPPQMFKRPPFWKGWSYEIKNKASWSSSMALPNFMKIHRSVQKLLVGHTHTQTGWWFDKPTFIFGKKAKKEEGKTDTFVQY
jgi:hypothetical protein